MADRVAVLRRGVLQQVGPPAEVYADPQTLFVAAFLGTPRTNLLEGALYVEPAEVRLDLGAQVLRLPADDPRGAALAAHHTERVTVAVRADGLRPVGAEATGPTVRGVVRLVENLGHEALVYLDTGSLRTSLGASRLEHPDTGQHLADVVGADPETGPAPAGPLRQTLSRMIPTQRQGEPPPPTARTSYGFYPVYDPDAPGQSAPAGDLVLRVPQGALPRQGDTLTVAVDLDRLWLFDRDGRRIGR